MTQQDRRIYLINELLKENPSYGNIAVPEGEAEQKRLLRALFNVRDAQPASDGFLKIQDEYLQNELSQKHITDYKELTPVENGVYLWQGDITTLKCDAIVNAANSEMRGCFCPNHGCIDNAIHTYAGVQLRLYCDRLMREQGCAEKTGGAKLTPAFNLPCKSVIHTVGPIVRGILTRREQEQLASCYVSCLTAADENGAESIAFCCISTGEYGFPNKKAAQIAVDTVEKYRLETQSRIEVIFNVFKDRDLEIYRELFKKRRQASLAD